MTFILCINSMVIMLFVTMATPDASTANLRTKILDFKGFGSSRILISRGGILMSTRIFPARLSQQLLFMIILEGRLGVHPVSVRLSWVPNAPC